MEVRGEPWASGQLVSYARTPALYYITSLLTQQGHAAVLLGTTNRDEGGYLGFIGRASDAMVGVQVLSDLHKSEVYAVAKSLGAPESVLQATPTGDIYDGRADEEVFGAPYDFVELYLLWKDLGSVDERNSFRREWSPEAEAQFAFFAHNLEELHRYNRHKYIGKSPAMHLDILHAATPGGWNNSLYLTHTDPLEPDRCVRRQPPHPGCHCGDRLGRPSRLEGRRCQSPLAFYPLPAWWGARPALRRSVRLS